MNRDDVIKIARLAGVTHQIRTIGKEKKKTAWRFGNVELERFAELVAKQERERCAKLCEELGSHWNDYKDAALLNGDVALSNALSGEPRAASKIAEAIKM